MKKDTRSIRVPLLDEGDDVVEVGLNGTMYLLRRGEEATVDGALFEVLKNAGLLEGEIG